jgi:uncharacterized repeat protein (TIGR03803 family)
VRPAYSEFYSFKGGSGDGADPYAGLINFNGTLYGTTYDGGANDYGTVFSITRSGTETLLHGFKGGSGDGAHPYAGLVNVKGRLYGTTYDGGAKNHGTVFSITPSGTETVLYSFKGGSRDGANPYAGLVNVKGTLYGTTHSGGANAGGTVFSITPSGTETVLHSFGGSGDGEYPFADLFNVSGMLYGTTMDGGAYGSGSYGSGTVFAITTSGTETVLHSFGSSGDGANPYAGLVNVKGTFYGTTLSGGANNEGTVFSITPSGTEAVLHSFGGSGDAYSPYAGLVNAKGILYGTTFYGGANGQGTVFSITLSGRETLLYSFQGGSGGGYHPYAGLVSVKGTLYGTTYYGGADGDGTVFSLSR